MLPNGGVTRPLATGVLPTRANGLPGTAAAGVVAGAEGGGGGGTTFLDPSNAGPLPGNAGKSPALKCSSVKAPPKSAVATFAAPDPADALLPLPLLWLCPLPLPLLLATPENAAPVDNFLCINAGWPTPFMRRNVNTLLLLDGLSRPARGAPLVTADGVVAR